MDVFLGRQKLDRNSTNLNLSKWEINWNILTFYRLACLTECEFGAICTEQNECQCVFNCTDNGERIVDKTSGKWYSNQCQLDQAKCKSFYEKSKWWIKNFFEW